MVLLQAIANSSLPSFSSLCERLQTFGEQSRARQSSNSPRIDPIHQIDWHWRRCNPKKKVKNCLFIFFRDSTTSSVVSQGEHCDGVSFKCHRQKRGYTTSMRKENKNKTRNQKKFNFYSIQIDLILWHNIVKLNENRHCTCSRLFFDFFSTFLHSSLLLCPLCPSTSWFPHQLVLALFLSFSLTFNAMIRDIKYKMNKKKPWQNSKRVNYFFHINSEEIFNTLNIVSNIL